MRPKRAVVQRAASRPSRHCDVLLTTCDAPLTLRLSLSAIRGYDALVLYRCETCDARRLAEGEGAPAIQLWGVLPEDVTAGDEDEDPEDCSGGRSW